MKVKACLGLFLCSVMTGQITAQTKDTLTGNQINIDKSYVGGAVIGGDQTNYYGLDSLALAKIDSINIQTRSMQKEMNRLMILYQIDVMYGDSLLLVNQKMSKLISEVQFYKHLSDSLFKLGFGLTKTKRPDPCEIDHTGSVKIINLTASMKRVSILKFPHPERGLYGIIEIQNASVKPRDSIKFDNIEEGAYKCVFDWDGLGPITSFRVIRIVECEILNLEYQ